MVRLIIEVDTKDELAEMLALLGDRPITIQEHLPSREERLAAIFAKYKGRLPKDYHFNRDEAHER